MKNLHLCSLFVVPKEWTKKTEETIQPNINQIENFDNSPNIIE